MAGNLKLEGGVEIHHLDFLSGDIEKVKAGEWIGLSNSPLSEPYLKVKYGVEKLNQLEAKTIESSSEIELVTQNLKEVLDCSSGAGEQIKFSENQIKVEPYWAQSTT